MLGERQRNKNLEDGIEESAGRRDFCDSTIVRAY